MLTDDPTIRYKSLFNSVVTPITQYSYEDLNEFIREMVEVQEKAEVMIRAAKSVRAAKIDAMSEAEIQKLRQYQPLAKSDRQRLEAQGRIPRESKEESSESKEQKAIKATMLAFNYTEEQAKAFIEKNRKR